MEYTREQHQALRNIDIQSVCERFSLTLTDEKRIKNAVDVLMFIKGVPFSEAICMLSKAFPDVLKGPLPVLSAPRNKTEKKTDAPAKENLTLRSQKAFFAGVACSKYDILLVPQNKDRHTQIFLGKKQEKILDHKFQFFLRQANFARDAVYVRPAREVAHGYIFIDDIDSVIIGEMKEDGHVFAAVLETSPKNFQAWMDAGVALNEQERYALQRYLAQRYSGDLGSTSGEHYGRLPGFLNTKNQHFDEGKAAGQYPWVMVRDSSGAVDPAMAPLLILDDVMGIKKAGDEVSIGDIPGEAPETAMEAHRTAQLRLKVTTTDNSVIDFAACRILWDAGYSQEIIAGVLLQALKEDGRDRKHPGENYVRRTVSRALADKMPAAAPPVEEEAPTM